MGNTKKRRREHEKAVEDSNEDKMAWSEDWAVQPADPGRKTASLPPGQMLRGVSGRDIRVAKGAASHPNARMLAILPGIMSLSKKQGEKQTPKDSDAAAETENETTNAGEAGQQPEQSRFDRLGTLEDALSEKPVLNLGSCKLQGQRIPTATKFLVLTVSKSKVVCRHVFDSVVTFGRVQQTESYVDSIAQEEMNALHHYGGSTRAIDGSMSKSLTLKSTSDEISYVENDDSTGNKLSPKEESVINTDDGSEDEDAYVISVPKDILGSRQKSKRSASKTSVKYNGSDKSSSEESSSSEEETIKPRVVPRRPAKAPAKYVDENDEDDESYDSNANPDDEVEDRKPTRTRLRKGKKSVIEADVGDSLAGDAKTRPGRRTSTASLPRGPPPKPSQAKPRQSKSKGGDQDIVNSKDRIAGDAKKTPGRRTSTASLLLGPPKKPNQAKPRQSKSRGGDDDIVDSDDAKKASSLTRQTDSKLTNHSDSEASSDEYEEMSNNENSSQRRQSRESSRLSAKRPVKYREASSEEENTSSGTEQEDDDMKSRSKNSWKSDVKHERTRSTLQPAEQRKKRGLEKSSRKPVGALPSRRSNQATSRRKIASPEATDDDSEVVLEIRSKVKRHHDVGSSINALRCEESDDASLSNSQVQKSRKRRQSIVRKPASENASAKKGGRATSSSRKVEKAKDTSISMVLDAQCEDQTRKKQVLPATNAGAEELPSVSQSQELSSPASANKCFMPASPRTPFGAKNDFGRPSSTIGESQDSNLQSPSPYVENVQSVSSTPRKRRDWSLKKKQRAGHVVDLTDDMFNFLGD